MLKQYKISQEILFVQCIFKAETDHTWTWTFVAGVKHVEKLSVQRHSRRKKPNWTPRKERRGNVPDGDPDNEETAKQLSS